MIKNTLPNKSGNLERLEKYSQQLESSSTNVHIVDEDLLRAFYNFFFVQGFMFQVISEKILCGKAFTRNLRDIFT